MTARTPIRSFRDLDVYKRGQTCMQTVHVLVLSFPDHEKYGLVDQMRRSSKSVGALVAEGWGLRRSEREFKNYLRRALGSANEMEAHFDTARLLGYIDSDVADKLLTEYREPGVQLVRLIANWKTYDSPPSIFHPLPSEPKRRSSSKDSEQHGL